MSYGKIVPQKWQKRYHKGNFFLNYFWTVTFVLELSSKFCV